MLDFTKLYEENWGLNHGDDETKETPFFWDTKAKDFSQKAHSILAQEETSEFLNLFNWSDTETVLDVGAGPGTHSIPLSKRVKTITATDFSTSMLKELETIAESEKINNIELVHGRWLEIDFKNSFDTVLCLNSLGVISCDGNHRSLLIKTLEKLKKVTKKRLIILIPHADSPLDENMRKILGLENLSNERRRIAVLYYAMVDCGMLPDLKILSRPFRWIFSNIKEASDKFLTKSGVNDCSQERRAEFENYLSQLLKKEENGKLTLTSNTKQALYTNIF